jgi:hypothetical protein
MPYAVAVFIIFFDVWWFYRSFSLMATAYMASKKIRAAENVKGVFMQLITRISQAR